MAAFVKSFKMLGNKGGILICSTQYNGLVSGSMLPWKLTNQGLGVAACRQYEHSHDY